MSGTAEKDKTTEEETVSPTSEQVILADTREKLEAELESYRPAAEAFARIEQVLANFDAITSGRSVKKATRRGTSATAERAPRGSRLNEFLTVVSNAGDEGLTVTEAFNIMNPEDDGDGPNKNYLYRLAGDALKEGQVTKDGKRYIAVQSDADAA